MPADPQLIAPLADKAGTWLGLLQDQNIIKPIGPAHDPFKVIRLRLEIDDWPLAPPQQALPGVSPPTPAVAAPPPGAYLQQLRQLHAAGKRARVRAGDASLPAVLGGLADEIEDSRYILDLSDNWDGEGSEGYKQSTWSRAIRFLCSNAERVWLNSGDVVPTPDITPGPRGSIDLHWRLPDRELLINFPADESKPVRFYGDDGKGGTPIEGELELGDSNTWMLMWLIRR